MRPPTTHYALLFLRSAPFRAALVLTTMLAVSLASSHSSRVHPLGYFQRQPVQHAGNRPLLRFEPHYVRTSAEIPTVANVQALTTMAMAHFSGTEST